MRSLSLSLFLLLLSGCGLEAGILNSLTKPVFPAGKPSHKFALRWEYGELQSERGPELSCLAIEKSLIEDLKKNQPVGPYAYRVYGKALYAETGGVKGRFEASELRFDVVDASELKGYRYEHRHSGRLDRPGGVYVATGMLRDGSLACEVIYSVRYVVEKIWDAQQLLALHDWVVHRDVSSDPEAAGEETQSAR